MARNKHLSFCDFNVLKLHGLLVHDEIMREFFNRLIVLHNKKYPEKQINKTILDIYIKDCMLDFNYKDYKTTLPIQPYITVLPKYKTNSMNPDLLIIINYEKAIKLFGKSLEFEIVKYMQQLLFAIFNKIICEYFKDFIHKEVKDYLQILANSAYISGLETVCLYKSRNLNHILLYKYLQKLSFKKGQLSSQDNAEKQSIKFTVNTSLMQTATGEDRNILYNNENIEDIYYIDTVSETEINEIPANLYNTQNLYLTFQQNPKNINTTRIILSVFGVKSSNNIISDVYSVKPSANTLGAYIRELEFILYPSTINPLMGIFRHVLLMFLALINTNSHKDNGKNIKTNILSKHVILFMKEKLKDKNYKHNKIALVKEYCLAVYIISTGRKELLNNLSNKLKNRVTDIIKFLSKIKKADVKNILLNEILLLPERNICRG